MPVIGLRQLSRETAKVVKELQESGEPLVITKQGVPIATLTPVDASEAQNIVLGLAPAIRETSSTEEVDIAPRKTRSLDELSEELSEELVAEAAQSPEGQEALVTLGEDLAEQQREVSAEVSRVFEDANRRAQVLVARAISGQATAGRVLRKSTSLSGKLVSVSGLPAQRKSRPRRASKKKRQSTKSA